MAYESFYGGRQGASFVLKKTYHTITEMIEDFAKGGITTREVNYGEYVMIDTLNKNDADNGKVFRRGMDLSNEYGGGEYIGQICGPDGKVRNLIVTDYNDSLETKGAYDPSELVPGKYESQGEVHFNDEIKYSLYNLIDENGNVQEYQIGFQFPYAVIDFDAEQSSAYDLNNLVTRADDASHPFYEKLHLKIPKGIKGDSIEGIYVYPTLVKDGAKVYNTVNTTTGALSNEDRTLTADLPIEVKEYWTTLDKGYVKLIENNVYKYAYFKDCYGLKLGYVIVDYDESAEGDKNLRDDLPYDVIEDAYINTGSPLGTGDQKIHLLLSTIDQSTGQKKETIIGEPLNYIIDVIITQSGVVSGIDGDHLLIYFSDPVFRGLLPSVRYPDRSGNIKVLSDFGDVRGPAGKLTIETKVDSLDDLYLDGSTREQPKTPEDLGGPQYKGWVVAVGSGAPDDGKLIYAYDYVVDHDWYYIGKFDGSMTNPSEIITISPETNEPVLGPDAILIATVPRSHV